MHVRINHALHMAVSAIAPALSGILNAAHASVVFLDAAQRTPAMQLMLHKTMADQLLATSHLLCGIALHPEGFNS